MTIIDHFTYHVAIYITVIYTIATTKYMSSSCFSGCQYMKKYSIKNNVEIIAIGYDMRIK